MAKLGILNANMKHKLNLSGENREKNKKKTDCASVFHNQIRKFAA